MSDIHITVDGFLVRDGVEVFAQEDPSIYQMLGNYSSSVSEAELRPSLQVVVQIAKAVERVTGVSFHNEILFLPNHAAEVLSTPIAIHANGGIVISEQWLHQLAAHPNVTAGLLLHEASHYYHRDGETTKHLLPVWNNMSEAYMLARLFDAQPESLTAAVKEVFGSVDAFTHETQALQNELMQAVRIFPRFAELGKLSPLELLVQISSDPSVNEQIRSLPMVEGAVIAERIKKFAKVFLLTPGCEALEAEHLERRGVTKEDAERAFGLHRQRFPTGELPDVAAVQPDEVAAIRNAVEPLRAYGATADEFTDFMQAYMQANEHRADIYAAYHLKSAAHYNYALSAIHDGSETERSDPLNNGVKSHPNMPDRMRAVSEAMGEQPSPVIDAGTAEHHGAKPMTRLMALLSEQWQQEPADTIRR